MATNPGWNDKGPIIATYQGELPPHCAALCMTKVQVQLLTMKAIEPKDLEYARYAMMMDPLVLQNLEPAEAREMANDLFDAEKECLGYFRA